ncbi:MAG: hypothetical protein N2Z72_06580, partial [Bacteroidales bacterium]|nr:hypothetical protein [Bacteroidales bacterium]
MKTFALDLGQSSIGWVIRNDEKENHEQFEKFGVIVFEKGVDENKNVEYSLAAERTKYRSMRRLYQARKYRLWETLKKLHAANYCPIKQESIVSWCTYDKKGNLKRTFPVDDEAFDKWIKLDFNGDGKPDFRSPYQLRKFLVENELDFSISSNRYMLGRALYHIAQHRAFKSSKKTAQATDEDLKIRSEEEKKSELFKRLGIEGDTEKTVGQLLAEAEDNLHLYFNAEKNHQEFKDLKYKRIRNDLHPFVTRKMLVKEVEKIFEFQFKGEWEEKFKNIFGTTDVSKCTIFWQRPLRSQKGLVGKCLLEKNKPRCPKSRPEFEIFRAWQVLNNIRYKTDSTSWVDVPLNLKEKIFNELFITPNLVSLAKVKKIIENEFKAEITLNYDVNKDVPGCPSIYYLTKIIGEDWQTHKIYHEPIKRLKKQNSSYVTYQSSKNYYTWEDLWHVIFQLDDEDEIKRIAREKFQFNDEQIKHYLKWFHELEDGYASFSLKAIRKINYFLTKGWEYDRSVLLANIPYVLGKQYNQQNEDLLLKEISNLLGDYQKDLHVYNIANALISDYPHRIQTSTVDFFAREKVEEYCKRHFGEKTWENLDDHNKYDYVVKVGKLLYDYSKTSSHQFFARPNLTDKIKEYLRIHFNLSDRQLNKMYHHSQGEIYPAVQPGPDAKCYLQSPKTGYWRNPMALRVLQELRQLVNYLIKTDQLDRNTRVVVEVPRELNDANRRKAYKIWQERREEENKEFSHAIYELINENQHLKANPHNDDDIDKFRLWYEQCFSLIGEEFTGLNKPNEKQSQARKDKNKDAEVTYFSWKENSFEKIRPSLWYKLKEAKDNVLEKYRLWLEQQAICIYTGRPISLTQLFSEDKIDIEHTIPYSLSFDDSLANKTVCFKDYNRNIKKNRIPAQCKDHDEILERIKPWKEKIEEIRHHLIYWENKSKRARSIEEKNKCIVEKHLWKMELDYWTNKVSRFEMEEVSSQFVNAQLTETQLISKYAFHYLKTVFDDVRVQKGSVVADFAKILKLRVEKSPKDRTKHTHHAIDALVLSLIPSPPQLKKILEAYAKCKEIGKLITHAANETDENYTMLMQYEHELKRLLSSARIPNETILNQIRNKIEKETLVVHPVRHKIFLFTKKRIRKGPHKGKYMIGDTVRGQLHKETFYGKIKVFKRDENGNGYFEYQIVKREPVDRNLDIKQIVDPAIKKIFEDEASKLANELGISDNKKALEQMLKNAEKDGGLIYTNPITGRTIRIRHVRCIQHFENPLVIKQQTYPSPHEHKRWYYANNAENIYYGLYESEDGDRTFEVL